MDMILKEERFLMIYMIILKILNLQNFLFSEQWYILGALHQGFFFLPEKKKS